MKKILLFMTVISAGLSAAAQPGISGAENMKTMTIEEANRLNGTAQPTINGKPYSQYKAEQEALKQKNATPAAAPASQNMAVATLDGNKMATAKLPELTPEQISKINATKAELMKNWATRDPNEDPNKPQLALSEELLKARMKQAQPQEVAAPSTTANASAGTPINKPVMIGTMMKGSAVTAAATETKTSGNPVQSQGVEVKPAEEVKASPAKLEAKATKE